ncbi:MAG: hypothetical protein FWF44_08855 [Defluviitaleaceae bacterium]|nr:hypothetical protein [Defluviitaleaceae bacterium]
MRHTFKIEFLPAKEFLVIKGVGQLGDPAAGFTPDPEKDAWQIIRRALADGSVERLKKAAGSETVFALFCNTCVWNEADKCYDCGCDLACENLSGAAAGGGFDIVSLRASEYAVYDCEFADGETALENAHEKPDELFWGKDGSMKDCWLADNPYVCAIDDKENWKNGGAASIEQYTPFDPDVKEFSFKVRYPIVRKEKI